MPDLLAIAAIIERIWTWSCNNSEKRRKETFDRYVTPVYDDCKVVVDDYLSFFDELAVRIERGDRKSNILNWIRERRNRHWPTRERLREVVSRQIARSDVTTRFERGVWGVMKGAAAAVSEGHADTREYGWGDHTVLDLLEHWERSRCSSCGNRDRMLATCRGQQNAIRAAWKDVAAGYADLRERLVDTKP